MRCHEGQQKYNCSCYLARKWQIFVNQVFLFVGLVTRSPCAADDAAQAAWRPTRSCRSSMKDIESASSFMQTFVQRGTEVKD